MMNKKGFSVLELILAFSITTVVVIYLFQIISLVQKIYIENGQKTEYLINQNILTDRIYRDLEEKGISHISVCDSVANCYNFTYSDGVKKLQLYESEGSTYISYGSYVEDYGTQVKTGNLTIEKDVFLASDGIEGANLYDSILQIKIPIYDSNGSYDINVVYQFNSVLNDIMVTHLPK